MLMYLYSFHWESTSQRMQVVHFLGRQIEDHGSRHSLRRAWKLRIRIANNPSERQNLQSALLCEENFRAWFQGTSLKCEILLLIRFCICKTIILVWLCERSHSLINIDTGLPECSK